MTSSSGSSKQQPTGPGLWDRTIPQHPTGSGHSRLEWEGQGQDLSDKLLPVQLHNLCQTGEAKQRRCVCGGHSLTVRMRQFVM